MMDAIPLQGGRGGGKKTQRKNHWSDMESPVGEHLGRKGLRARWAGVASFGRTGCALLNSERCHSDPLQHKLPRVRVQGEAPARLGTSSVFSGPLLTDTWSHLEDHSILCTRSGYAQVGRADQGGRSQGKGCGFPASGGGAGAEG